MNSSTARRHGRYWSKRRLAKKVSHYPLLRLLLYKRWFRLFFLLCLAMIGMVAIALPKVWRTSPPDFTPVIKVSLLDLGQAWSLRRAAEKGYSAGLSDEAIQSYRAALANNRGNPEYARGLLRSLKLSNDVRRHGEMAQIASAWLLYLTATNRQDLLMSVDVLEHFRLNEVIIRMLDPVKDDLTPDLEAAQLRALFNADQIEQYYHRWQHCRERLQDRPDIALYEAAFMVGWGLPETMDEGRQRLGAVQADPALEKLSSRLQSVVALRMRDLQEYEKALQKLIDLNEDTPSDHANYWMLLNLAGRKSEAIRLAQAYPRPPVTSRDLVALVRAYLAVDLRETARDMIERYLPEFRQFEGTWIVYGELLVRTQQWDKLATMALQVRREPRVMDALNGFSFYIEGRAAVGKDRRLSAESAFRKAAEFNYKRSGIEIMIATNVARLGFPDIGRDILMKSVDRNSTNVAYWRSLVKISEDLKDDQLLRLGAENWYQLDSTNTLAQANYAAALLAQRDQAQEAIALTMRALTASPYSASFRLLHSLALVHNKRLDEAEELLRTVDASMLVPQETATYQLIWFELHLVRGRPDLAREALALIDPEYLFASERAWLDVRRKELASPSST